MRRRIGAAVVLALAASAWAAAPPTKGRPLTGEEQKEVEALEGRAGRHFMAGQFEQAAKVYERIAEFRRRHQGAGHWQVIDARLDAQQWRGLATAKDRAGVVRAVVLTLEGEALYRRGQFRKAEKILRQAIALTEQSLGRDHPQMATTYNKLGYCLADLGKEPEALLLYRKALAIREETLGTDHPHTATSYTNVGYCLHALGKSAQALPLLRKALGTKEKVLGPGHPSTAASYNAVGICLEALGEPREALPLFRQALAVRLEALGPDHPDTATSYGNLASCLAVLGRRSEALPLYRRALDVRERVLGKDHPDTAIGYHNMAHCLHQLGRPSEALPLQRKALDINEKALGRGHRLTAASYNNAAHCLIDLGREAEALPLLREALAVSERALGKDHPHTAASYNSVASCLHALGKDEEALALYRSALEIREKVLGKDHTDTAGSYHNIAGCLYHLGRHKEALQLYRRALAIHEKALGEGHPSTASSRNNLACCLRALGRGAEALPLHRRALAAHEKALGQNHPRTGHSYNTLALCLLDGGQVSEAARLLQQSLAGQEAARFHLSAGAGSGFDRAVALSGKHSPRALLAVLLARLGQPRNAYAHAEASLARGLLDDLGSPRDRDAARLRQLHASLAKLDADLVSLAAAAEPTRGQRSRHEATVREHRAAQDELARLVAEDSARRVLPLGRIQKCIPHDAALVLWIDAHERWACVVRREGVPAWVPLPGSGKGGRLTATEWALPPRVRRALTDPGTTDGHRREQSAAFVKHLFDPLKPHLKGVKRLFVVPTGPLARVPLEALTSGYAVSYVPSGSVLALLREGHRPLDGRSLLALGDPPFERAPPPEPPGAGVLVRSVVPGGNAAKAGLRAGDVLLSVGGVALGSFADLDSALKRSPGPIQFWREGARLTGRVPGAPLGAAVDERSARAAVRAWRREREAVAQRGTGHERLPGTKMEVEEVAALVKGSTALLGSDASEQRLDELIDQGELKKYRILHFATHGEADERSPWRSALILAQDRLPDPLEQSRDNRHPYDGRLTVSRIRHRWRLDADLVVLSACETGLGRDAGGEGLLGFAQAFLTAGARSVVLSRWKVDDGATALLMVRFYENLLGKRAGAKPLGRAAALDEAKRWLRTLTRKEAERLATLHAGGALRGSEGNQKPPAKAKPVELKGERPYAHPFYWAAFTLIGDPD